jgi:hypothetical protein
MWVRMVKHWKDSERISKAVSSYLNALALAGEAIDPF